MQLVCNRSISYCTLFYAVLKTRHLDLGMVGLRYWLRPVSKIHRRYTVISQQLQKHNIFINDFHREYTSLLLTEDTYLWEKVCTAVVLSLSLNLIHRICKSTAAPQPFEDWLIFSRWHRTDESWIWKCSFLKSFQTAKEKKKEKRKRGFSLPQDKIKT